MAQTQLAKLQQRRAELELQSASRELQPDKLVTTREDLDARITAIQTEIESKENEKRAIETAFAADLARYRALKAKR